MIRVTENHIRKGTKGDVTSCPISLACKEIFPDIDFYVFPVFNDTGRGIRLTCFGERTNSYNHRRQVSFFICDEFAYEWIDCFDSGESVVEFDIDFDLRKRLTETPNFLT